MLYRDTGLVVDVRKVGKSFATLAAYRPNSAGSCGRPFTTAKVSIEAFRRLSVPVWNAGPEKDRRAYVFYCAERIAPLLRLAFPGIVLNPRHVGGHTPQQRTDARKRKRATLPAFGSAP